jgi:hypothetical protein
MPSETYVPFKREDLLVLWTVREHTENESVLQIRGRVYFKDDPVTIKPRLLTEVLLPKSLAQEEKITMTQMLAMAEERLLLDLGELNSSKGGDPWLKSCRRSMLAAA